MYKTVHDAEIRNMPKKTSRLLKQMGRAKAPTLNQVFGVITCVRQQIEPLSVFFSKLH